MPASRFADAASGLRAWAEFVGLPLPRRGEWHAAGGWLALGTVLLAGGVAATVLSVWSRLVPATRPLPARLLPLAAALALADCAAAGAFTRRPAGGPAAWRLLTVVAAVFGAVWTDPVGFHARLWLPWAALTGLLAWVMRAAETLGAAMAGVRLATPGPTGGPHAAKQAEDPGGRRPVSRTWRTVAEGWLLAAACAAIGGAGPGYRDAAACAVFGGAVLVLGAQQASLRASWRARRFAVDTRQIDAHWRLGLAIAFGLVLLALTVPLPGGVPAAPLLGHLRGLTASSSRFEAGGFSGGPPGPPPAPRTAVFRPLVALAAVAVVLGVIAASRPARTWALLRRLLAPLLALWTLWRRFRGGAALRGPDAGPAATGKAVSARARHLERPWPAGDPRAAVRAAYRRFLRAMAAAGTARPPHVSPRAYLRNMAAAPAEVDELTSVYELARYSDHAPERRWVALARRGLRAVARVIRRRV